MLVALDLEAGTRLVGEVWEEVGPMKLAEGFTLQCDVVLSEDLHLQVQEPVEAEPLRRINIKGRDQDIMVYGLIGLRA